MHNFKKIIKTIVVVAVCVTLLAGLDMALYPCTFMRNDIHAVVSNQYDEIILGTSHGMTDIDPAVMEEITGRSGHNVCVGGEYGIDAYYIARLIAEKQKPARIIYEVDPGYFVSEKEEGNNYYFIMSFHFQKLRLNTSGILLQNAISALFCFPGMSILLDMSLARWKKPSLRNGIRITILPI